jgi:predicted transcriptional regulator
MTRRSSQRALAREIYREMASQTPLIPADAGIQGDQAGPADSCPGSQLARGRAEGEQNLTQKARSLYENSAVPVAEIARLCGVTERTIYKYAAKERWTPRYRWAATHPRRWRAEARVAPVKGAGGRFVRRADKGQPFASGLKATDPRAAAQAAAACAAADGLARAAQKEAEADERAQARVTYLKELERLATELNACRLAREQAVARKARGLPPRGPVEPDFHERMLTKLAGLALSSLEQLAAEDARALREQASTLFPSPLVGEG